MSASILTLAESLGLSKEAIEPRGHHILKIEPGYVSSPPRGKVVLVTAMTPTPAGEGKTTTLIGLVDALRKKGARAMGALREPSLGPIFGHKGGAVGGGKSQLFPAEAINLHFTGDIHAVTSAHNLLAALADNHLYFGKKPALDPARVVWGRVLDMNDRALRQVELGREPGSQRKQITRPGFFDITAASEVMAVLCLSRDLRDLRGRLDRLLVGFGPDGDPVTARDLGAGGAMAALLLDAARPNMVRSLEGSPFLIHGGPFANIAQGTSSLIATQLARKLADIVLTEAGFAFDLGGFKFFDLKGRVGGFRPAAVVMVSTIRALRYHGGARYQDGPNPEAVEKGIANLDAHLDAMQRLQIAPPLIAINRFPDDSPEELALVKAFAERRGTVAVESHHFAEGGAGGLSLAEALLARLEESRPDTYLPPYQDTDPIPVKLEKVAKIVLGAEGITLSPEATRDLQEIERLGAEGLPICLAKTHLSISDKKDMLGRPAPFSLRISRLKPLLGAGFVVARCGDILTMPGLPERPAADDVELDFAPDGTGRIIGLK